jgi:hypothetical protein
VTLLCIAAQAVLVGVGIGIAHLPATAAVLLATAIVALAAGFALRRFTAPPRWKA